jgi:hypothetical protein
LLEAHHDATRPILGRLSKSAHSERAPSCGSLPNRRIRPQRPLDAGLAADRFLLNLITIRLAYNCCVVLVDHDPLRATEIRNPYVLQLNLVFCIDAGVRVSTTVAITSRQSLIAHSSPSMRPRCTASAGLQVSVFARSHQIGQSARRDDLRKQRDYLRQPYSTLWHVTA